VTGGKRFLPRCRRCKARREPWERLTIGGYCPTCSDLLRALRTRKTSTRLLAKAKPAGTVERDGQEFRVVVLPPKRRSA
jgi:hypothetical protein